MSKGDNEQMLSGMCVITYSDIAAGGAPSTTRFVEEAGHVGMTLHPIGTHDVMERDGKLLCNSGTLPDSVDFAMNRQAKSHVRDAILARANAIYNDVSASDAFCDKFAQVESIRAKNVRIPRHVLGHVDTDFDELAEMLGVPFVAKGLISSCGNQVFLISSRDDMSSQLLPLSAANTTEWLFDEFISSSFGTDLRLYSLHGEALACERRTAKEGFRANLSQGGTSMSYPVTRELRDIASDIYECTHLDICGTDLLFGDDGFWLCEVNTHPGIIGLENATGANVARATLQMIADDMSGKL